ncbi:MAG: 50S ribosomal protein L22 [Candidatus Jorgensenbacteria bacterium]
MPETTTAKLKYLHITPRKTRAVADLIRGLSVNEAEAQLSLTARRAGVPLLKLLRSAVANAKQVLKKEPAELFVKEIRVDLGPRFKRWNPRARGAVNLVEKKMSHVTVVLGVMEHPRPARFVFPEKPKKEKKEKKEKRGHKHEHEAKEKPAGEAPRGEEKKKAKEEPWRGGGRKGFLGRLFRRKAV